jgi:hypothetical protein
MYVHKTIYKKEKNNHDRQFLLTCPSLMNLLIMTDQKIYSFEFNWIRYSYKSKPLFFLAYASKLSFFDILFLNNNFYEYNILGFYNYFIMDLYLSFNSQFLQKLSYFSTNNQDSIILVL